ncbi:ECF-type riboflavin transporter substrate-binding protein [Streptococcus varani]
MKNNSIKSVVAIGVGAALFVIIGMLVRIPTGVPNTNIQLQYAVVVLLAIIFGPTVGFLSAFIGHTLIDAIGYGSVWWTWVLVSALFGLVIGFASKFINLEKGSLSLKDIIIFNLTQVAINILGWGLIAPFLDILIYSEDSTKVYTQGLMTAIVNSLTVAVGGTILLAIYAKSRVKQNSLTKE